MTTTDEQILWEADFQIVTEKELNDIQNNNINTINDTIHTTNTTDTNATSDDEDMLQILKETWVYDALDEETRTKLLH